MATEYVGAPVKAGGDHVLIPTATQATYAQSRASGNGVSKVRFGSLR